VRPTAAKWEKYKRPLHTRALVCSLILRVEDGAQSQNQGKIEDVLQKSQFCCLMLPLSMELTFLYDIPQGLTVVGIFRDRFAEVPRLACPIIHNQGKMVGSYCASHHWTA
jgi:hypothetical protein